MATGTRARRFAVRAAIALLVLALMALAVRQVSKARCFVLTGEAICRVETKEPLVALSLDDGPSVVGTDAALSALEAAGVRATFFLIGREVDRHPEQVRRIVAAGHETANHSYSHVRMIFRPSSFYDEEIRRGREALERTGAGDAGLFRPPFGRKLVGLLLAAERQGRRVVMWDVAEPDTDDPRALAQHIVREARPGSIILMHVMSRQNVAAREALPDILAGLKRKGLRVVTVSELLARAR